MKQISLLLNVVLLVFIICYSCRRPLQSSKQIDKENVVDCLACDSTFDGVPADSFMQVVARYRKTTWDVLNKSVNSLDGKNKLDMMNATDENNASVFRDSRCIWFSLDTIKEFICHIEKYTNAMHMQNDKLGIRFYYAVYPGKQSSGFPLEKYKTRFGQHTLYMVPTRQSGDTDIDWDPKLTYERRQSMNASKIKSLNDSTFVDLSTFLSNSSNLSHNLMIYAPAPPPPQDPPRAWNNGKLCPVNCPPPAQNTLQVVDNYYPNGLGY